ncbi:hypothetical protein V0U79_12185 [Hyphobacterium sp. HN65]|uniref:DUF3137 domain-containing protein n=1 Tax=Hyphobacterium lacteum TaxID=3116575 RepID=A0ABU7LT93_9PROT|nr:hypothetical protein [Hyphobacterium sp. HN65]MEE2527127.1 hypothetical protein [Hyphobacterium sp. HN65]
MTAIEAGKGSGRVREVERRLAPYKKRYGAAYRNFLMLSLASAVATAAGLWWIDLVPAPLRVALWILIAGAAASFAYRPLGALEKELKPIIEQTILEPYELSSQGSQRTDPHMSPFSDAFGDTDRNQCHSPFDMLDLLPSGEKVVYSRRYARSAPNALSIQEIEVKQLQLNRVNYPDLYRRNWRTVFIGQGVEAGLPDYSGPPFVLVPRRREIHSLELLERNTYLQEKYERRVEDSALSERYQIWIPERLRSFKIPGGTVCEAALKSADLFPYNQLCLAVTPDNGGDYMFRLTIDIGRLFRDSSSSRGAMDMVVIAGFDEKLHKIMEAVSVMTKALNNHASDSPTP